MQLASVLQPIVMGPATTYTKLFYDAVIFFELERLEKPTTILALGLRGAGRRSLLANLRSV